MRGALLHLLLVALLAASVAANPEADLDSFEEDPALVELEEGQELPDFDAPDEEDSDEDSDDVEEQDDDDADVPTHAKAYDVQTEHLAAVPTASGSPAGIESLINSFNQPEEVSGLPAEQHAAATPHHIRDLKDLVSEVDTFDDDVHASGDAQTQKFGALQTIIDRLDSVMKRISVTESHERTTIVTTTESNEILCRQLTKEVMIHKETLTRHIIEITRKIRVRKEIMLLVTQIKCGLFPCQLDCNPPPNCGATTPAPTNATTVPTTMATTPGENPPTTVPTTQATTPATTKATTPGENPPTTVATTFGTTVPQAPTNATTPATTRATTPGENPPTTVPTTQATTPATTKATTPGENPPTTQATTKPPTTRATTPGENPPTTVASTFGTTVPQSPTNATTPATTRATTPGENPPTTVPTTQATTPATTQATTPGEDPPTTVATTQATTQATTPGEDPPTTVATTQATTQATTPGEDPPTTVATTQATTKATTPGEDPPTTVATTPESTTPETTPGPATPPPKRTRPRRGRRTKPTTPATTTWMPTEDDATIPPQPMPTPVPGQPGRRLPPPSLPPRKIFHSFIPGVSPVSMCNPKDSPKCSAKSCLEAKMSPFCQISNITCTDGLYYIDPSGEDPMNRLYCDMTEDGGGWTLLLSLAEGDHAPKTKAEWPKTPDTQNGNSVEKTGMYKGPLNSFRDVREEIGGGRMTVFAKDLKPKDLEIVRAQYMVAERDILDAKNYLRRPDCKLDYINWDLEPSIMGCCKSNKKMGLFCNQYRDDVIGYGINPRHFECYGAGSDKGATGSSACPGAPNGQNWARLWFK